MFTFVPFQSNDIKQELTNAHFAPAARFERFSRLVHFAAHFYVQSAVDNSFRTQQFPHHSTPHCDHLCEPITFILLKQTMLLTTRRDHRLASIRASQLRERPPQGEGYRISEMFHLTIKTAPQLYDLCGARMLANRVSMTLLYTERAPSERCKLMNV